MRYNFFLLRPCNFLGFCPRRVPFPDPAREALGRSAPACARPIPPAGSLRKKNLKGFFPCCKASASRLPPILLAAFSVGGFAFASARPVRRLLRSISRALRVGSSKKRDSQARISLKYQSIFPRSNYSKSCVLSNSPVGELKRQNNSFCIIRFRRY